MTAVPLLMRHEGKHRRQYEPGPLALFFRRILGRWRRKPAVPAGSPTAGAATALLADRFPCCLHCEDGSPCDPLDQHLAPCYDCDYTLTPHAAASVLLANRNAEALGFPVRVALTEAEHDGAETYQPPAPSFTPRHASTEPIHAGGRLLGDLPRRQPGASLPYVEPLADRGPGRPPWYTTVLPVYGEVPQQRVREAGRLAGVMLP